MRSGVRGRVVSVVAKGCCLCAALLLCSPSLLGAGKDLNKVILREEVPLKRRSELAAKLRAISGWSDLKFDDEGILRQGAKDPVGGSATARELIAKAVSGPNVLIIEDASNRTDVVFCKVVPGRFKNPGQNNRSQQPPVYVVLVDFADFDHLMGDTAALNAFDAGWGVLHEFDHVVSDSADTEIAGETGECESHINEMRRECNLPRRTDYFFNYLPHADESAFMTRFVRLAFDQEEISTGKRHRYWLAWDAKLVGGLGEQKQVASLR